MGDRVNALQAVFGSAKTPEDIVMESHIRAALEYAAAKLERQTFKSESYRKAMKTAAKLVRDCKPP